MTERMIKNFDLFQTASSGQCFRMLPATEPGVYTAASGCRFLKLAQIGQCFHFFCPDDDMPFWNNYFDLDTDYTAFIDSIDPKDAYLLAAAEFGSGIRILRQDPWEMIITFIISQQKTIPAIRSLIETLCRRYGSPLAQENQPESAGFFSFPSPEQLNLASLDDLLELKLGYRAKYIKSICTDACSGKLNLQYLHTLNHTEAMEYLMQFSGIGEKVASCICLYGLHHISAFPVDTWIKKILLREYAPGCRAAKKVPAARFYETLVRECFSRYQGYAGVMQQYMFFYERSRSSRK